MKISYVTEYDASDIHNWSGLGFNIAKSLEDQRVELSYVSVLRGGTTFRDLAKKIYYKGIGKTYLINRTLYNAKRVAKHADYLMGKHTDIVFSPGTFPIALMENNYPKVFYTDATFAGMLNFYPDYFKFSSETIKIANYLEQKALDNCSLAIYSSDWAAETALENYHVDRNKVKVVPFGANLQSANTRSDIKRIVEARSKSVCKLLFVGADWKRKGGDFAVEVTHKLIERGIKAELHIAGVKELPFQPVPAFVKNHGFISKSNLEGISKFESLFAECHYLILPTIADCSPVVFNEAASFGLPSISTQVGGISTIIKNHINGRIFPLEAKASDYANYLMANYKNSETYQQLALSSFKEFQDRLSWDVSGKKIVEMLRKELLDT